jgi:hypothetical protein
MASEQPSIESDASTVEPRTQRARTEDMLVALRKTGGIYSVRGESGNTYRADVATKECTCPDAQKSSVERCKHIRRVEIEIRNRTVPTPDGRLPEPVAADGGIATDRNPELSEDSQRVEGPIPEYDKFGEPTGAMYFRCTGCGREAMREKDLSECCADIRE